MNHNQDLDAVLRCGTSAALADAFLPCPEAERALLHLMLGNESYCTQTLNPAPLTELIRRQTAHEGQHPRAVVVCCADSRVPPEHIFSAGIGELFVIRNAGNVMSPTALASVEYAVAHLHVPLVLVMGHRGCGAVASALVHSREEGALGELIMQVSDAIGHIRDPHLAELKNLRRSVLSLGSSAVLRAMAEEGKAAFAGAMYDIRTGRVELLSGWEP